MYKKQQVEEFFEKNSLPPIKKLQYAMYCAENGYINQEYFNQIARKSSKTVSLKTGGMNARETDILNCMMERAELGIDNSNAISLDEKLFCPSKCRSSSVTVGKNHKGYVPSNQLAIGDQKFITLQMAITKEGVLHYNIIRDSSTVETFNDFLAGLCNNIPDDGKKRFIILDNGKFHQVSSEIQRLLIQKKISMSFNPPLACYLNPIEEVFSEVKHRVDQQLYYTIMQNKTSVDTNYLASIINSVLKNFDDYPFIDVFRRACILDPKQEMTSEIGVLI